MNKWLKPGGRTVYIMQYTCRKRGRPRGSEMLVTVLLGCWGKITERSVFLHTLHFISFVLKLRSFPQVTDRFKAGFFFDPGLFVFYFQTHQQSESWSRWETAAYKYKLALSLLICVKCSDQDCEQLKWSLGSQTTGTVYHLEESWLLIHLRTRVIFNPKRPEIKRLTLKVVLFLFISLLIFLKPVSVLSVLKPVFISFIGIKTCIGWFSTSSAVLGPAVLNTGGKNEKKIQKYIQLVILTVIMYKIYRHI